jgi:CotH kinase protein
MPFLVSLVRFGLVFLLLASPALAQQERAIVTQFDADRNGRLDATERKAAQEFLLQSGAGRGGGRGRGGFRPPPERGVTLTSNEVKHYPGVPLYDEATLRTFFIDFDNPEWEAEMVVFNNTDVEVPATVTVDGKVYKDVGVHFRGNSSFGVGNGYKRSLNLTFDFVHDNQAVEGYRTLNFLNANADPSMMRTVLSMHVARQYIPAPKANFVRVVINGENWGIYENAQQFNKDFLRDHFKTTQGTRWKIPQGGFGGGIGGFTYFGDDPNNYRATFQIKSKEDPQAWATLVKLPKLLQDTPPETLEAALAPILDIDGLLRFLALDTAMAGGDGFYQRVADYSLYLAPSGRFHFIFHDANEMFNLTGGRGGPGGGGVNLDPFVARFDTNKPIISKVLAVPALRAKYVSYVKEIAEKSFDWKTLGPVAIAYRDLIAEDVARDTRKLFTTEAFVRDTSEAPGSDSLRMFFDRRRAFLLTWAAQAAAAP